MRFTQFLVDAAIGGPHFAPKANQPLAQTPPIKSPRHVRDAQRNMRQAVAATQQKQPQAKPAAKTNDPWAGLLQAAQDNNTGRELITLLGAMYQAKRRNPNVQLSTPKLISTLPDGDLKNKMATLFKLAQGEDLPQLAARSKEIQQARIAGAKNSGNQTLPPSQRQQPTAQQGSVQPATKAEPTEQGETQQNMQFLQRLLQQIRAYAPKLTSRQIKKVSKELNTNLKKKEPTGSPVELPQAGPKPVISTG